MKRTKKLNKREQELLLKLYKYEQLVCNIAYKHIGNTHDAEDITHDTYEKIINYFDSIIDCTENEQVAYLIVVARSCARDKYRKNKRESELLSSLNDNISDNGYVDFLEIEASDSGLFAALRQLPEESNDIIILRCFFGHEVKDIAKMTGLKESSVYQRLRKAKRELIDLLNDPEIEKLGQKGKHKKPKKENDEPDNEKDGQTVTEVK